MKVAVVTGGNKGIGYAIVKGLCEKYEGLVYLTARDVERGEAAVAELKKLGLKPKFHQLDVTDQKSLDSFRDFIKKEHDGIDILVNNAAIAYKTIATEPFSEQAENTLHVNYFSLLKTCDTLFPLLRPHARVVNLSSSAGHLSRIPGDKLKKKLASPTLTEGELSELMKQFIQNAMENKHQQEGWPNSTYSVSKVGVSALSFIQQRAFDSDSREDIVVNAVHPGYVDTDMTSHKGPLTIEQGADAPIYLALLPDNVESPRGNYIWCNREIVDWVKGPMPGADVTIYLALLPDNGESPCGNYMWCNREIVDLVKDPMPGADAPIYLALLPDESESLLGNYIWCNREIVDWVKGQMPGADVTIYLALLPDNGESPIGNYIWCNREIVDWVKGQMPGPY